MSYNISQVSVLSDLTPFYVRKMIKTGKLPAHRELIGDTRVERWVIEEEDLQGFLSRERKGFGKRDDGRNKYTVYLTHQEFTSLTDLMSDDFDQSCLPTRSNPPKSPSNGNTK